MDELVIAATRRDVIGKKVKTGRLEGKLPAVLYGKGRNPVPVWLDFKVASRQLLDVTPSSLIRVELGADKLPALVRDKQRDILRGHLIHVDFQIVSLTETVRANVAINLDGESPAVQENNAFLVSGLEEIEVECLPQDLPGRIDVDISTLVDIGDAIYVRDLVLPPEVEVLSEPDELVALVTWIAAEEIEEEEEEELFEELEEPEVIERGKREEEEEEED